MSSEEPKKKKNSFEIFSFSNYGRIAKRDLSSKSSEAASSESDTSNSFEVLYSILDYSLFPLYSFEPQEDVKFISTITKHRGKSQEKRREFQKEKLDTRLLLKNTFFQCFEPISHCFVFDESILFPNDIKYVDIQDSTINELKNILRSDGGTGKPFSMPGFLSFSIAMKKIHDNPKLKNGILLKKLYSDQSVPIVEKNIENYLNNFYQSLILYKNIKKNVEIRVLHDYFLSWESDAPTVLDYRCFLVSKNETLRSNMISHFLLANDDDVQNMMIIIFNEFVMIPKVAYIGEEHMGFLSARWIAPFFLSMEMNGLEMNHFSEMINPIVSDQETPKKALNDNLIPEHFETIHFIPSFDFNDQNLSVNINEKVIDSSQDLTFEEQKVLVDEKIKILNKIKYIKSSNPQMNPNQKRIFDDHFLLSFKNSFSKNLDTRKTLFECFHGEMLHQWSRDLVYLEILVYYLDSEKIDETKNFSFIHNNVLKQALRNDFDHFHLIQEENFSFFENANALPVKKNYSKMPIIIDDIMYSFFLLLDDIMTQINTRKNENFKLEIPEKMIKTIRLIHQIQPSIVLNWAIVWLLLNNIPFQSGYSDKINKNSLFNVIMLPNLYRSHILPIKKSESSKITSFDKNIGPDYEYIWMYTNDKTVLDSDFFISQQINFAKMLIYRFIFFLKKNQNLSGSYIDMKRYFTFSKDQMLINTKINEMISMSNTHEPNFIETLTKCIFITEKINIEQIQYIIDFHLAILNQIGSFLSFLFPKGNNFENKTSVSKKQILGITKQKSGAGKFFNTVTSNSEETEELTVHFDDLFNPPSGKNLKTLSWIFSLNPNLEPLEISLNDIKRSLNDYIKPSSSYLQIQTQTLSQYPEDTNIDIKNYGIPIIEKIIEVIKELIRNDSEIEYEHAKTAKKQINADFKVFLNIYLPVPEYSAHRFTISNIEKLTIKNLQNVKQRKRKLERFLFIRQFLKKQTYIVEEFYHILHVMQYDVINLDTDNVIDRLRYSLYNVNNFINRELPLVSSKRHEIIERNIVISQTTGNDFRIYLSENIPIVSLQNFRYLYKSISSGQDLSEYFSVPEILIKWRIFIKDKFGNSTKAFENESFFEIEPYQFKEGEKKFFHIAYPYFPEKMLQFLSTNHNCVIYSELHLFLQKDIKYREIIPPERLETMVVYHPLSMPETDINILGQDVLSISDEKLFERIKRFNNFTFINQPDNLLFFHANIIQSVI